MNDLQPTPPQHPADLRIPGHPMIFGKMSDCAKAIGYGAPKDGKNKQQNYDYTSAASVRKACAIEMGKHRICVGSEIRVVTTEMRQIGSKHASYCEVVVTLTFYAEDGSSLSAQGIGSGMDYGDKAVMKAQTAAEKYALCSAFSIAMGEDPEADESIDRGAAEEPRQERQQSQQTQRSDPAARRDAVTASSPTNTKALAKTLTPADCLEALTEVGVIGASQRVDFSRGFFACDDADQRVLWKAIKDHAQRGKVDLDVIKENMRRAGGD